MEPREAAATLLQVMSKSDSLVSGILAQGLSAVLSRSDAHNDRQCSLGVAGTVGGSINPLALLTIPARLQIAIEPLQPLPAQTLVDILKDPLCVGKYQGLVLEQLARRYGRPFADQWEFARYAEEHDLGLDLLGPRVGR
jgi:hypothetical protein